MHGTVHKSTKVGHVVYHWKALVMPCSEMTSLLKFSAWINAQGSVHASYFEKSTQNSEHALECLKKYSVKIFLVQNYIRNNLALTAKSYFIGVP